MQPGSLVAPSVVIRVDVCLAGSWPLLALCTGSVTLLRITFVRFEGTPKILLELTPFRTASTYFPPETVTESLLKRGQQNSTELARGDPSNGR